jgi:hypothetical protein
VDDQLAELLPGGLLEPERPQPLGRDPARRGLPLADLVAIEHQQPRTGPGELAGDGEAGEARPADDYVEIAVDRGPLVAALGQAPGHRPDGSRRRGLGATAGP